MSKKIKIDYALCDICKRYRNIRKKDIEIFAPVFYPIARIQADMQEKTFEDFEFVQESVLKFMSLGFKSETAVADLMGLNDDYVLSMMKLLFAFGHIDKERNVTELGKQSIAEGKKITLAHTKQVFLIDAVNCSIIRVDKDVDRTVIESVSDLEEWEKGIQFLDHSAGMSKAEIQKTLMESDYDTLKRIRGGLNINVTQVSDVECLGIKFIKSYLLKLKGHPPVIFTKRFDFHAEGTERFLWLPFSVESALEAAFFGIGTGKVQVHSQTAKVIIDDVYKRIVESMNSEKNQERILKNADYYQGKYGVRLTDRGLSVCVSSSDVFKRTNAVLFMLKEFGTDGDFIIADDNLSGRFFYLYPDKNDILLTECSKKAADLMEKYSYERIVSHIESNYQETDDVIKELSMLFDKIINN